MKRTLSENKMSLLKKINSTMDDVNKVVDAGKSLNKKLGSPLDMLKNKFFSKPKKTQDCSEKNESAQKIQNNGISIDESSLDTENTIPTSKVNDCESNVDAVKTEKKKTALDLFESQLRISSENPSYGLAVKKLMSAELGTLRLLQSPNALLLQNFSDLVMEHLLISYENIDDSFNRVNFQRNAGLLIRSIVNYLQARIAFLEDEDVGVQDLIDNASNDIASVSYFVLGMLSSTKSEINADGIVVSPVGGKASKLSVSLEFDKENIKNACDELRKIKCFGIFTKIFLANKKIKQEKKKFYSFLADLFENLNKYRFVFGDDNRIVSQLIERYGSLIAEEECFSRDVIIKGMEKITESQPSIVHDQPPFPQKRSFSIPACILSLIVILFDAGIIYAITDVHYFILLTILIVILSIIILSCSLMFIYNNFYGDDAEQEWLEKVDAYWRDLASFYYKALAKTFYDFDKRNTH